MKLNTLENLKFEEIFDPGNFKENANLSLYMGLANSLSDMKSIMLLTYGYSGVGKTFTLFGSAAKEKREKSDGLLQTTLNNLTNFDKIELKAFELYGLGVPYKFYWESNKFEHFIYNYKLIDKQNIIANFGGREHSIKFNIDYTEFSSTRKDDLQIVNGKLIN
jgi:hypothetical protein